MDSRQLAAYQGALADLNAGADYEVRQLLRLLRFEAADPVFVRESLEDALPVLVEKYGRVANEISAEWFIDLDPTDGYKPIAAPPKPDEQVVSSAKWAAQPLFTEAPEKVLGRVTGSVQRYVYGQARDTIMLNAERQGVPFARVARVDGCPFCRMLASRGFVYEDESAAGGVTPDHYHDSCVPADTVTSGPLAEYGTKRWYEGEIVTIYTASGEKLAITPNHPILTDKGWVPAGLIDRGCNVVRSAVAQPVPVGVPDEYQEPSLIEDIWGALAVNGLAHMPQSAKDFHGDGIDGEVKVVGTSGRLGSVVDPAIVEHGRELIFAGAGRSSVPFNFASLSKSATGFPGSWGTGVGCVGGSGIRLPICGAHAAHADQIRFGSASPFDAKLSEYASDGKPGYAELLRHGEFGHLLVNVKTSNGVMVDGKSSPRRFDPAFAEDSVDVGLTYARLGDDLLRCLAGQVELDNVVDVRRGEFLGHVFNLQTSEGWYAANNVIVSNCRCLVLPKRRGVTAHDVPNLSKFRAQYYAARSDIDNTQSKAALRTILSRMGGAHDHAH